MIASLCVLSYQRAEMFDKSIKSLLLGTDYPHEIIINDDGSTEESLLNSLFDLYIGKKISYLILNAGKNRGVGKSFRNCIGVSSGEYIFKLDADLIYQIGWLGQIISILSKNGDVGCCGLFNYRNYDPNDTRFEILEERDDCYIVSDFVNSGYGFRREIYNLYGADLGDDGWQQTVKSHGFKLAIPKTDVVQNIGFGEGKSVYVQNGHAVEFHKDPLVFGNKK